MLLKLQRGMGRARDRRSAAIFHGRPVGAHNSLQKRHVLTSSNQLLDGLRSV